MRRETVIEDNSRSVTKDYKQAPTARTKESSPALQVADFAAYEIMKAYGFIEDPELMTHFFRTTLGMLSVMMPYHKWGQQSDTAIRAWMNYRGIPKRQ